MSIAARTRRFTAAALPALALGLAAQGLPTIPDPPTLNLPSPEELLPLRPYGLDEGPAASKLPFAWRGEQVSEQGDAWTLEQGAVQGQGVLLLADRIRYDTRTGEMEAEGHIRLEAPDLRLRCEHLKMNWRSQRGEAFALELDLPPTWTLRSARVSFETFRKWSFEQVELSPCPEEKPGWRAKLSSLKVDLDGFAQMSNLRVLLGPFPTYIYLPYGIYPAKLDRGSGLLLPTPGISSAFGTTLKLGYYQVLGDGADATFSPEWLRKEGVLWGGEMRWHPTLTNQGSFSGQYIHQQSLDTNRYRYSLKEVWDGEGGWQLAADVNDASDNLVDADFGSGLGSLGQTNFDGSIYLGKTYRWGSLGLSAARQRTFFLSKDEGDPFYSPRFPTSLERRTLPQLEARFFPVGLGPFYLDGDLRTSRFGYRISGSANAPDAGYNWAREDGHARLYGRLGQWGPLRADAEFMVRGTHYGNTLETALFDPTQVGDGSNLDPSSNPAFDPFRVDGPGTMRWLGSGHIRFSGPQLGRSYEHFSLFGYTGELKHVVEPFFGFTRTTDFADAGRLPRFDAVDSRPGVNDSASNEESIELGLKQYFLGRPGAGEAFAALARWKISTRYHFKPIVLPDGRVKQGWASLDSDIDVEPNDRLRISFRRSSGLGSGGTDQSLSADFKQKDGTSLSLAYFSTGLNQFLVRQKGIQLGGLKRFVDDRMRLEVKANYDFGASDRPKGFVSSEVALAWVDPCVAYILRYTHVGLNTGTVTGGREDRLDLIVNLRSLGDFFSLRR